MRTSRRLLAVLTGLVAGAGLLLVAPAAAERQARPHARTAARAIVHGHVTAASQNRPTSFEVFAQPKARKRARAPSRGGVWRKPNPKMRGDEQEPDMRCGTPGTSGHVTTKSSIRVLGVLYKSGVYARTVLCLTLGGLHAVRQRGELSEEESEPTGMQKSAEGIVGPAQARLVRHPKAERRGNG